MSHVAALFSMLERSLQHEGGPDRLTVEEIYQRHLPYRSVRTELGIVEFAAYERGLLELLAGRGGYLRLTDDAARDELQRELDSPNPILGLYRDYSAAGVEFPRQPASPSSSAAEDSEGDPSGASGRNAGIGSSTDMPASGSSGGVAGLSPLSASEEVAPQEAPAAEASTGVDSGVEVSDDPPLPDPAGAGATNPPGRLPPFQLGSPSVRTAEAADAPTPDALDPRSSSGVDSDDDPDRDSLPSPASKPASSTNATPRSRSDDSASAGRLPFSTTDEFTADESARRCIECEQPLPEASDLHFCPFCGRQQKPTECPGCGLGLRPEWNFCIRCGTAIEA